LHLLQEAKEVEYTVDGTITLSPYTTARLISQLESISPSGVKVGLKSESDEKWVVSLTVQADDDTVAGELAKLELDRICDLPSFYDGVAIYRRAINGMSYRDGSVVVLSRTATASAKASIAISQTFAGESMDRLSSRLKEDYPEGFLDVASVWRDATSRDSSTEKFFSLYRLLERLCDDNPDKWIQEKDPSVQMYPKGRREKPTTVYTYLRDNIHPKPEMKLFPAKEIQANLPKFQNLVKQRIAEKFGVQL
jgi:hypothetical protein